ncbi:hypothetical protein JOF35_004959 [Streptomyces demainii]|uniref:Uncharacterized protein n=1 Tax=Streptomyces demainii TaxID=588122 RepID=A0ABT9KYX8_9ACTN|nr:hypothetical protein [Streptomyces demainii]
MRGEWAFDGGRGRGGRRGMTGAPRPGDGDQTGGATNTPRSGSLNDSLATGSFIGFAVPRWSVTSGWEKS